jgi:hypothetical protein
MSAFTDTVNVLGSERLPLSSVAVQVTRVSPTGKLPEGGEQLAVTSVSTVS